MDLQQNGPGQQPGTGNQPQPGQLPAPGSLPQMPDAVVNYENKSLNASGSIWHDSNPQQY